MDSRAARGDLDSRPAAPVLAVSPYGIDGASSRVRVHEWFDHTGIPVEYRSYLGAPNNRLSTVARRIPDVLRAEHDLRRLVSTVEDRTVFLSREATPFSSGGIESSILRRAGRGVYDFDDALYADDASLVSRFWSRRRTWLRSVESADSVIAGSEILADAASAYSDVVTMIPSCIEPSAYVMKDDYDLASVPRAVWIGSPATEGFLLEISAALLALNDRYGLRLTVISSGTGDLGALTPMVDRVTWSRGSFATDLVRADFGLMPLPDTPYTRGKCSYKLLQYAAAALPLIGSPVGANEGVLARLGGLAAAETEEWITAAGTLIEASTADRAARGASMRTGVMAEFSFERWRTTWLAALGLDART